MSEKEEIVVDNLKFTLSEASELTTYLAAMNATSGSLVNDDYEPDWDRIDDEIGKIDDALQIVNDDWQIFKENYAVLKDRYNDDD